MELTVTEKAAQWYEEELEINESANLRFYVRYGGVGGLQPGFSLAIKLDEPAEPLVEAKVGNIRYFIEAEDEWYFDGHSLSVELNEKWQEPDFQYEK
ncbi:hypothetical protein EQV77_03560 [Halobacillus fulvus]|nr:hypothetical protein EQV77_03560 [Halobacillus fulvus]